MLYLIIVPVFFVMMLLYFKAADRFNIIDKPNERSSHTTVTIRGGGVIFIAAACLLLAWHFQELYLPLSGIILIGIISFMDDMFTLSNALRISVHIFAMSLLFLFLGVYSFYSVPVIIGLYVLSIGIVNAYNFMDGINGITGLYSLVILAGLQYINLNQMKFVPEDMIWMPMAACVVFLYFNFRKKARCFAGDVGSVTIAFWVLTLLLKLMIDTANWVYILFLAVYGVDSILTIIHRLILRQNIFQAHRLHFYQVLANEQKVPHLVVSVSYAVLQLLIITVVITNGEDTPFALFALVILPMVVVYVWLKPRLMSKKIASSL
jgi:UDP-N-acetylmuramyl pentapeptide phosphotransferase/UDP-N-acetylglucosamine-1-phosphate transferase